MRHRDQKDRVLGPYRSGRRWIVALVVGATGKRNTGSFSDEQEARKHARDLRKEIAKLQQTSVSAAISSYRVHLKTKGNKVNSIAQTIYRLTDFFADQELPISMLDSERCAGYYNTIAAKLAVDTHRNRLSEAKTFLRWCVKQRWIRSNPLEAVEGVGKRRSGKTQLRIDEARKWLAVANQEASKGSRGAIAAMMTLLLGLRASEVVTRTARDVDDDGRILWVDDVAGWTPKTEESRRHVEIPQPLRGHLVQLAAKKKADELLFGIHWRDWPRHQVRRICDLAGVRKVSAHGMRGLNATLAVDAGVVSTAVAASLGHESFTTTKRSYAKKGAVDRARQKRALKVLEGGKADD